MLLDDPLLLSSPTIHLLNLPHHQSPRHLHLNPVSLVLLLGEKVRNVKQWQRERCVVGKQHDGKEQPPTEQRSGECESTTNLDELGTENGGALGELPVTGGGKDKVEFELQARQGQRDVAGGSRKGSGTHCNE